jgi:hypothetical protein
MTVKTAVVPPQEPAYTLAVHHQALFPPQIRGDAAVAPERMLPDQLPDPHHQGVLSRDCPIGRGLG